MFRKYNIKINIKDNSSGCEEEVSKIFGCSITEPSNWVEYGTTKERGLTFLDKEGKELDSVIFKHQQYFNSLDDKKSSEKNEIKELICQTLFKHYHLNSEDVSVTIIEV